MKKKNNKYIIGIIGTIILLLFLLFIFVNDNRNLTIIESLIKDTSSSIVKVVNIPINYFKDQIIIEKEKQEIYIKYKNLKKRNEKLELENSKYKESINELSNLKKSLRLTDNFSDYEIINSSVIQRNVGYWYDTITIDKGISDGVKEEYAVITKEGLVGKIIKTSNLTSTVKLLTSITEETKISVKITDGEENIYGLLTKYDEKTNNFVIEGIAENKEIKKDLIVTTTGLDNIFPSGIVVGKVTDISKDNFDLTTFVYVKSNINFDDLRYVMVAKRNDIK